MFFKRLFSRKRTPAPEPPHGLATQETTAAQDATREHMEAEVADDRERRGATEIRPNGEQPPGQDSA
jgi:hypothetical protein